MGVGIGMSRSIFSQSRDGVGVKNFRLGTPLEWGCWSNIVLSWERPSSMCAKLRTVAASNNRNHAPWSLCYCLFTPHIYGVVLRVHSVHGEPHI